MEVAEFIAKNYYKNDTTQEIKRVRELLAYPGIYFYGIPDDGLILMYFTLSDEGIQILRSIRTQEEFTSELSEKLLKHPGEHIYVFRMITDRKPTLHELRTIRLHIMYKHKAVSFSWHDDHQVKMHTYGAI